MENVENNNKNKNRVTARQIMKAIHSKQSVKGIIELKRIFLKKNRMQVFGLA